MWGSMQLLANGAVNRKIDGYIMENHRIEIMVHIFITPELL
jgi:hypothetical protein